MKVFGDIIGLSFDGKVDLDNMDKNKLAAVLNIAGTTFPLLETMGLTEASYKFVEKYCWSTGLIHGCAGVNFEFYLGWYIGDKTSVDFEFLNVTFVPYIRGEGNLFANLESWFTKFSGDFYSKFVNIESPFSTQTNFKKDIEF